MNENRLSVEIDFVTSLPYLKKGDRIRLMCGEGHAKTIMFATVDMEGSIGRSIYINVKFDYISYSAYNNLNTTVTAQDKWRLFVSEETAQRINAARAAAEINDREQRQQQQRAEILKKIAETEKTIAALRAQAEAL